jgi:hypothetical protein
MATQTGKAVLFHAADIGILTGDTACRQIVPTTDTLRVGPTALRATRAA